jgi:bifunctional DNA-binding transcriptional regulator/antitoxin component of YhaV-PrlF toxin-antitoxin module
VLNEKLYEYDAVIQEPMIPGGYATVPFPYDVRAEFGKGRVNIRATFDGEPYDGIILNMGAKNEDGSIRYSINVLKEIRAKIGKQPGDSVHITVREKDVMDKTSIIVPEELTAVMETDVEAKAFFESLTDGYKRGYCDWIGGAKQAATRQTRAEKALIMLQKKQKTLKT